MIQEKGNTDSLSRENGGLEVAWERGWLFVTYAFIHLGGRGGNISLPKLKLTEKQ